MSLDALVLFDQGSPISRDTPLNWRHLCRSQRDGLPYLAYLHTNITILHSGA